MLSRKYSVFYILLFVLLPVSGFSQFFYYYSNPLAFAGQGSRYTIGSNLTFVSGEYTGLVPLYNNAGNMIGDTVVKRGVNSKLGSGIELGVTLPIARTGRKSSYDVSVAVHYNTYVFDNFDKGFSSTGQAVNDGFFIGTLATVTQIALPLSIDLKYGSDAIAKRKRRFGTSIGVGVIPQYQSTLYAGYYTLNAGIPDATVTTFSVAPFVKAEFSAYWLFCFRLKAYYAIGGTKLFEDKAVSLSTGQTVTNSLSTTGQFTLSLTVLPFSYGWGKEMNSHGWWDDFESEEAMWRKN